MTWILIRENVLGMAEFEWSEATQKELHLTAAQAKELEAGNLVHTALKGGTDYYLVREGRGTRDATLKIACPMCGGSGQIERHRLGNMEAKKDKGKIA
jgi:DnaJ-class molecular chaperone